MRCGISTGSRAPRHAPGSFARAISAPVQELVAVEDMDSQVPGIDSLQQPPASPEVILLQSANRKLVNQALEDLPVVFREVIVMREIEDMTYKEIAAVVAIPLGTVMSRLSRGREMLKHTIEVRNRRAS